MAQRRPASAPQRALPAVHARTRCVTHTRDTHRFTEGPGIFALRVFSTLQSCSRSVSFASSQLESVQNGGRRRLAMGGEELDLGLLGLEPGKLIWGQLGKAWWPGRVTAPPFRRCFFYAPPFHAWIRRPRAVPRSSAMPARCAPTIVRAVRLPGSMAAGGQSVFAWMRAHSRASSSRGANSANDAHAVAILLCRWPG